MNTTLIWKAGTSRKAKANVLLVIRRFFATARQTDKGIVIRHRRGDCKPLWFYLLLRTFGGIQ